MNNSREDAESLDRRSHKAILGVALVRLKNLKYQSPPGRPSIPLQPRKVSYWLEEFNLRGCFPSVSRNRIRAKISGSLLNAALSLSGIAIDDLERGETLQYLELPEGTFLAYSHGQHRLEAARHHVYPHNVWWAVELLKDDALGPDFDIQEQDRNIESIPHDDGTVFRFIEAERAWTRAWCSKQAEVDLKAIEKRPALYAAFSALRPFVGLWQSFQKGTLHRFNRLKCDHELIRYLNNIKHAWMTIIGGDQDLAELIDANTVYLLEGRAPATSSADKEFILQQFEDKTIFPHVREAATRARLLRNILSIGAMIPSIRTFSEDTLWLEDSVAAMKVLIDPTKLQLRDALRHMWRGLERNTIVLEYANGLTQKVNFPIDEESQFEVASTQLWMFAMRNYPRLTSLCPKTDGKYKVAVVGPDPKCLQEFAMIAAALGFESSAITALLKGDPTRAYIRDMLTKARSREGFDYDIERQEQAHYELLQEIHTTQARSSLSLPPIWTTTVTDVKVDRRYGRPYDRALKECSPYFFLHYICQVPESGRYVTDLFVKRGIAQLFFRIPPPLPRLMLQQGVGAVTAREPVEPVPAELDDLAQARETINRLQRDNVNQATSYATIASKLEEAERRLVEQQKENSSNLSRLSESHERSARQVVQIQECQRKIAELEAASGARAQEESQERLEMAKKLHERQIMIESLQKTVADREELQASLVKASQDRKQILSNLDGSRSEVAALQQRIVEYQSQCDKQALDTESLRQQLAMQTQEAMTEKRELQVILSEWERGERLVATDVEMTGDKLSSEELQARIEELDFANQQQMKALMSSKEESALKSEGLEMIHVKIKGLREGVEKLTAYFATRLKIEPSFEGGDCETIHSEDEFPATGDLVTTRKQLDEIEELKRSFSAFIALYGRADKPHYNSDIEILEWQKDVSKAQLTISNEASDELEANTPGMDGMLSMVKRRAGIIEQEARNMHDLQTELEAARETIDAQRQRLEALDEELREARSQATLLQEEYRTAIGSLEEALTTAQKDNEATRKEAEDTRNLRGELSTVRADNETLRRREAELDAQVRGNAEAWRTEQARIHGIEQQLTEARSSLQATSGIEEELKKTRSDLSELREVSGSYIQELKATRDMSAKQLQASKARVTGLEKDLETARQSIKIMDDELTGLKAEANGDDRVRLLKAQLFELNALINLEKEKSRYETELKATQAAVAQAKAAASDAKRLGDLLGEEAKISAAKSEVERNIVGTKINILKYSGHKVRFQNAKIRYHEGVEHVAIDDIKRTLDKLHDKVLYCFIKGRYTLVEPGRFNDYLGNPSYLADDVEFFYCNPSQRYKRDFGDIVIDESASRKIRKLKPAEKAQIEGAFTF